MKTLAILLLVLCAACEQEFNYRSPVVLCAKARAEDYYPKVLIKDGQNNYHVITGQYALMFYECYNVGDTIR